MNCLDEDVFRFKNRVLLSLPTTSGKLSYGLLYSDYDDTTTLFLYYEKRIRKGHQKKKI